MQLDQFDGIAIVLGVIFAFRRLDARSRVAQDFPHVPPEQFAKWRSQAGFAYALISRPSFARVVFHFFFVSYATDHQFTPELFRRTALVADATWIVAIAVGFWLARKARHLRLQLGIRLDSGPTPAKDPKAPSESANQNETRAGLQ